jgi:predicted nucleotide-binding protein (sugar kinase/HSP70/actin superfamily)
MAARSTGIAQMGNQAGEGWYLTAEMVDMIEHGCPNIICAQPFACLPNHVIGKGMFRALRDTYPEANIVSVDYDPGASEVNQLNRIKLMISTAVMKRESPEDEGPLELLWDEPTHDAHAVPGGLLPIVGLASSCDGCSLVG